MSHNYDKKRQMASKMMGNYTKGPVTSSDHTMSERHLKHRAEVDKMAKKLGDKHPEVLKKSIAYNKEHTKEHKKALKDAEKNLKKLG